MAKKTKPEPHSISKKASQASLQPKRKILKNPKKKSPRAKDLLKQTWKSKSSSKKQSNGRPAEKREASDDTHTDAQRSLKRPKKMVKSAAEKGLSRHLLKKKLKETRKQHAKPNFELGKEVKVLWETLRKRNLENAERSRVASTILQRMKGKIPEMATSHVVSRVLQTCLKYCNKEEKMSIHDELRPHFLNLTQNTYSHHLVLKMLDEAATDKSQFRKMISSLHGHVVPFMRHPVGSAVVEHAYRLASNAQKQELAAEFFSPEYRLFKGIIAERPSRLKEMLANEPSSKRRTVLEHMTKSLQPILEKGIVDHSIIHRVLVEYLTVANKANAIEVLQQLSGPLLVRMIHTKDGAKLGVTCVVLGSRKERKKIIKGLKGCAKKVACDQYGCLVIMAILDVVDDTEIVNKFIVNELANNVKDMVLDRHGRRVFLHLLSPGNIQYVSPDVLTPVDIRTVSSTDENTVDKNKQGVSMEEIDEEKCTKEEEADIKMQLEEAEAEEGIERVDHKEAVSKKDPFVRRTELLKCSSLAEKLVDVCILHARSLLCSSVGKDVIYEVARGGHQGVLFHVTRAGVSRVHQGIADLGAESQTVCRDNGSEHVFEQYHASRVIRKLIMEHTDGVASPSFAEVLWKTALKGKCSQWATGHSLKVVSAYLGCPEMMIKKEIMMELKPLIKSGILKDDRK